MSLRSVSPTLRRSAALALGLALAAPAGRAAEPSLPDLTYSGDQSALARLDEEIQAAGRDAAKLAALEKRLLAALARRDATFAARQAVAQRLALVLAAAPDAKSAAGKAFAAMLVDARDADVARLALQPIPGAAVDALFVSALGQASGVPRLGLLDAIASRRIAAAVDPVAKLLKDADAATVAAAARTLGEIGNAPALAALRRAPVAVAATARLAAAARLPASAALAELRDLQAEKSAPEPLRLAAFRLTLDLEPAAAAGRIAEALAAADWARKQVALEAVAASSAPNLVSTLARGLKGYDAPTQVAVLAAFSRRADRAQVDPSVVLAATKHASADVRTAALKTLGFLPGSREIVAALAALAGAGSDEAKAARQALARLDGPGVSAAIADGAGAAGGALRPVYLEQLALRHQTESLPLLLGARSDSDAAVRLAAVAALGDIAPASAQPALLDWTLAAKDEAEQSRALRSLVSVIQRDPAEATRGQVLFDAIDRATPDVALRLLPALGRLGGERAANAAARLGVKSERKLADAAAATLARWTDATAIPALALIAETGADANARDTARAGAIRYFERNREPWTREFTAAVARLLKSKPKPAERAKLITFLHRADDSAALELATLLASDPAAGKTARIAADVIRANQAGRPQLRASGSADALKNMLDRKTSTRWNVPTEGAEWLEVDFRVSRPLQAVTLDQTGRGGDFPEHYEVFVTDNPKSPGAAVASGKGQQNKTVIALPEGTRGRYVIVRNTAERKDGQWAVVELYVD